MVAFASSLATMQAPGLLSRRFHGDLEASCVALSLWKHPQSHLLTCPPRNPPLHRRPLRRSQRKGGALQATCTLAAAWQGAPPVWRVAILGAGAVCLFLIGKKVMQKDKPIEQDLLPSIDLNTEGNSHLQMIVKGATSFQDHVGPWSVQDLALGLAAMAKMAEKEPPRPPGRPAEDLRADARFLACAQHWRAMAEAAYVCDGSSFSLQSQLPESALVHAEWNPDHKSLRPAYMVCIDGASGAVVLSIRGTSHVIDMLIDSGAAAESFCDGQAHAGFVHATNVLISEVQPHLKKAFQQVSKDFKLVIVGHSMGAAIGVMAGFKLRDEYPNLQCWGFSSPACLTQDLAVKSREFAISIISAFDIVPRFSITAVEKLRQQLLDFDWERAGQVLKGDPEWEKLQSMIDATQNFQGKAEEKMKGFREQLPVPQEESQGNAQKEDGAKRPPPPALYPPGRLLVLAASPPGCGKMPESRSDVPQQRNFGAYPSFEQSLMTKWALHEGQQEEFSQLVVSPWGVSDHMLGNLCEGLGFLQRQCPPYLSCPSDLKYT